MRNMSLTEQIVRFLVGLILVWIGVNNYSGTVWFYVLGIVGIILIVTGLVAFCPLKSLLFGKKKEEVPAPSVMPAEEQRPLVEVREGQKTKSKKAAKKRKSTRKRKGGRRRKK